MSTNLSVMRFIAVVGSNSYSTILSIVGIVLSSCMFVCLNNSGLFFSLFQNFCMVLWVFDLLQLLFGSVFHLQAETCGSLASASRRFFRSCRCRRGWCSSYYRCLDHAFLKVVVSGSKESIPDVSHSGHDDATVRELVVDHSDRDGNLGMGLCQEFQSGPASNNGDNVNFWNAPLELIIE